MGVAQGNMEEINNLLRQNPNQKTYSSFWFRHSGFFLLLLFPFSAFSATYSRTQILMGNVPVTITIETKKQALPVYQAMETAFKESPRLEKVFNSYDPASEVSLINREGLLHHKKISHEMKTALRRSEKISKLTNGAYDIRYASTEYVPKIDLFSIAKGTIVDAMSRKLRQKGYRHFIVNAGGDLFASGTWEVELRYSDKKYNVKNQAVASCGTTERGFHIIDPKTKRAIAPDYKSVTVIAKKTWLANTLATASFVAGVNFIGACVAPSSGKAARASPSTAFGLGSKCTTEQFNFFRRHPTDVFFFPKPGELALGVVP